MSLLNQLISEILKESYLFEIKQEDLQQVLLDNGGLPFSHIFDEGELRKAITIKSELFNQVEEALGDHGISLDPETGMAFYEKETKMGPKKINIKPGKALGKLAQITKKKLYERLGSKENIRAFEEFYKANGKHTLSNIESMLDNPRQAEFLAQHGLDDIETRQLISEYSYLLRMMENLNKGGPLLNTMIISRAPMDVLRMSDFKNIQSCHSPYSNKHGGGGKYWECAKREAQEGGAIAYLIGGALPEGFDLNQPEIFQDEHRDIEGLKPMARLRLRNFYNTEEDYELAMPDDHSYGLEVGSDMADNFESQVLDWAFEAQSDLFPADENGEFELPDLEDFKLRGGSYRDAQASTLFNKFFDVNHYQGDTGLEDESEEMTVAEQYQQEADEFENEFLERLQNTGYIDIQWELEEESQEPYIQWRGHIGFPIGQYEDWHPSRNDVKIIAQSIEDRVDNADHYDYYIHNEYTDDATLVFNANYVESSTGGPDEFNSFLQDMLYLDQEWEELNKIVQETIQAIIKKEQEDEAAEQAAMDKEADSQNLDNVKTYPDLEVYDDEDY